MKLANDPAKEDYSLRYTPSTFRKWHPWQVWITAIGSLAAMAGYAISGSFALGFGFSNALGGFLIAGFIIFLTAVPLAYYIADRNIDIDLLTRGAGFGYLGSTVTSLVYASFTLIYLAFEGSIMAQAITALTGLGIHLSYVVVSLAIVPLVVYGMRFTAKFQAWTQPLWVLLLLVGIISVLVAPGSIHAMTHLGPVTHGTKGPSGSLVLAGLFAVAAAQLSGAAQSGEQGDYLRFMPNRTAGNSRSWWAAVILGGPGMVFVFIFAFLAGLLLTAYALPRVGLASANVPVTMFDEAFSRLVGHNEIALVMAGALVILSQLKINIMNAYSGSLSWSNFFSRILHRHPGRVIWLIFQVGLGLVVMEAGIFSAIIQVLAVYSNVAIAWIACLVSDLVINKKLLKLSPPLIEFKRAHLYNFNPVGFGSMIVAAAASFTAYFGVFGPTVKEASAFIALILGLVLPPIVAAITKGRYYIARSSELPNGDNDHDCCRCDETFESLDMAVCPFHGGTICSLCCSTDGTCHDVCKTPAKDLVSVGSGIPVITLTDLKSTIVVNKQVSHLYGEETHP